MSLSFCGFFCVLFLVLNGEASLCLDWYGWLNLKEEIFRNIGYIYFVFFLVFLVVYVYEEKKGKVCFRRDAFLCCLC